MSRIVKKLMFILPFIMWMIYFFDIFSLRASSVINSVENSSKNTPKNMLHNSTFRNNSNHSYFKTILHKSNHNFFIDFHNSNRRIYKNNSTLFYENLTYNENQFLNRINFYRNKNNLQNLIPKDDLSNIANIISLTINKTKNPNFYSNYNNFNDNELKFLLDKYNISFKKLSINIITCSNLEDGFQNLCKSPPHNNNLLSKEKKYTGLSIIDSIAFGKIIVQLFVIE